MIMDNVHYMKNFPTEMHRKLNIRSVGAADTATKRS